MNNEEKKGEEIIDYMDFDAFGISIPPDLRSDERMKKVTEAFCDFLRCEGRFGSVRTFFDWAFMENGTLRAKRLDPDCGAFSALFYEFRSYLCDFLSQKLHLENYPKVETSEEASKVSSQIIEKIRNEVKGQEIYLDGFGVTKIPDRGFFRTKIFSLIPLASNTRKQVALESRIQERAKTELNALQVGDAISDLWKWFVDHWNDPSTIQAIDQYLRFYEEVSRFYVLKKEYEKMDKLESLMVKNPFERAGKAIKQWNTGNTKGAWEILRGHP